MAIGDVYSNYEIVVDVPFVIPIQPHLLKLKVLRKLPSILVESTILRDFLGLGFADF